MPAAVVYALAKRAGVSSAKAEKIWDTIKKAVVGAKLKGGETIPADDKKWSSQMWAYVMGSFKKAMGGKKESISEANVKFKDDIKFLAADAAGKYIGSPRKGEYLVSFGLRIPDTRGGQLPHDPKYEKQRRKQITSWIKWLEKKFPVTAKIVKDKNDTIEVKIIEKQPELFESPYTWGHKQGYQGERPGFSPYEMDPSASRYPTMVDGYPGRTDYQPDDLSPETTTTANVPTPHWKLKKNKKRRENQVMGIGGIRPQDVGRLSIGRPGDLVSGARHGGNSTPISWQEDSLVDSPRNRARQLIQDRLIEAESIKVSDGTTVSVGDWLKGDNDTYGFWQVMDIRKYKGLDQISLTQVDVNSGKLSGIETISNPDDINFKRGWKRLGSKKKGRVKKD